MNRVLFLFGSAILALPALAANHRPWPMMTSAPLSVEAGEEVSVCVANLSGRVAEVQLSLFNVRTGETISQREDHIPSAGGRGTPSDPCVTTTPGTALVAARVSVKPRWNGLPPRGVSASLQMTAGQATSGALDGTKRSPTWVPLEWSGLPLGGRRY